MIGKFIFSERLIEESKILGDCETGRLLEEAGLKLKNISEIAKDYETAKNATRLTDEGSQDERFAIANAAEKYRKLLEACQD